MRVGSESPRLRAECARCAGSQECKLSGDEAHHRPCASPSTAAGRWGRVRGWGAQLGKVAKLRVQLGSLNFPSSAAERLRVM